MRNQLGNLTIRNLIISYILLYSIMPIVGRLTSSFLTTYFYMAVVVVLVVLILVLDRPENLNLYGSFLLPFVIYGLLTAFLTNEDLLMWGFQFLLFLLPVILGYFFTQDSSRILPFYTKVILFAFIVTMVTTVIGCIRNPNASRELASVSSNDAISLTYDMLNIGGYNFVYYVVLLYPVLILMYKTRKIKLLPTVLITIAILFTVIYSEYTTALLLFVISSILFFTKKDLSARGIIIISVLTVLFALFFSGVIADFLRWLADTVGSKAVADRLNALAGGKAGLGAAEDKRLELYQMSLNVFFSNPIFGTFITKSATDGAHSFILDSLARYGLLGGFCLFFMYKRIFTRFFLPFKDKPGFGYVLWTFIQAIILSIVNTGMWLDVLCLFCPILFYWIFRTETETEKQPQSDGSTKAEVSST